MAEVSPEISCVTFHSPAPISDSSLPGVTAASVSKVEQNDVLAATILNSRSSNMIGVVEVMTIASMRLAEASGRTGVSIAIVMALCAGDSRNESQTRRRNRCNGRKVRCVANCPLAATTTFEPLATIRHSLAIKELFSSGN